jgi:hypothetical protein
MNPPVDFEERVKRRKGTSGSDYPYAIKARDLMENFVYATLIVDDSLIEKETGKGGHRQHRLKIPRVPSVGTYVLGAKGGRPIWIATEDC